MWGCPIQHGSRDWPDWGSEVIKKRQTQGSLEKLGLSRLDSVMEKLWSPGGSAYLLCTVEQRDGVICTHLNKEAGLADCNRRHLHSGSAFRHQVLSGRKGDGVLRERALCTPSAHTTSIHRWTRRWCERESYCAHLCTLSASTDGPEEGFVMPMAPTM